MTGEVGGEALEGIEGGEELGVETGGGEEEVLGVEGGGEEELVGVEEEIGGVGKGNDEEAMAEYGGNGEEEEVQGGEEAQGGVADGVGEGVGVVEGIAVGVGEGVAEDEAEGVAEAEPEGLGGENASTPSFHGTISFYKDPIFLNQNDATQATDPTFSNGDDGGFIVQASTGTETNGVHSIAVPNPVQKKVDGRLLCFIAVCTIGVVIVFAAVLSGSKDSAPPVKAPANAPVEEPDAACGFCKVPYECEYILPGLSPNIMCKCPDWDLGYSHYCCGECDFGMICVDDCLWCTCEAIPTLSPIWFGL